jgi:hypothetical protein
MLAAMAFFPCLTSLEMADGGLAPADGMMPGTHLDPDKAAGQLHRLVDRLEAELSRSPLSTAEQAELEAASELARQADEFYRSGDYASAALRLEGALALQERVLGENHLQHVELLRRLADTRDRQGNYGAVLPLIQRIADIHVQVLGPDHPTTLLAQSELVQRQYYEYGSASSRPLQENLLQSMEDTLGPDDPLLRLVRVTRELRGEAANESRTGPERPSASLSEKREQALERLSAGEEGPLAGLEDIDWHNLQHAYGAADDVPKLLRLLLSDDGQVRDSAWQELYGNIWHQGDVYQATSFAVPFFIRLLDSEEVLDKDAILDFLHTLATAQPHLSEDHTWMEPVLDQQGHDFKAEIERARLYTSRTHEAVSAGLDTYLAHLKYAEPHVRQAAAVLLCALPEHALRVLPAFAAQIATEHEVNVKAELVQNLGLLLETLPPTARAPYIELLADLVRAQESPRVRFAAAVALVRNSEDEAVPQAIQVLERAVDPPQVLYPEQTGMEHASLLFADVIVEEVCVALTYLSVESRIPVLIRILGKVTSPAQAHQVAVLLLDSALLGTGRAVSYSGTAEASEDSVFYGTVHPLASDGIEERIYPEAEQALDVDRLTPTQTQALRAVLDCPAVWSIRSNLLQLYGLSR